MGVLALQGDVREHLRALERVGARARLVRRPAELAACDGLVLPGGESTTMVHLARRFAMLEPLREAVRDGLPTFGTCAGMVLLADRLLDGTAGQETVGGLDVTVRRNAFGRQVDSFEGEVDVPVLGGSGFAAVFIRAPWVEDAGADVEVLGRVEAGGASRIVAVRQGAVLATSFHPEVAPRGRTGGEGPDDRLHRLFVDELVTTDVKGNR
ncbi:pyridoxal 5'-phosphate synthase subunit PdxT [Marmoricola endophyticus]|uniref:Pyridoxal 5'-phosphate synthase subunit PdxT n=1 Tax=Marmoricola endophyticus TaxID=2040280 RepID=A0A917BBY3_9ACTN|nr:pyridoxal 5'-phosphate synthase subunit PdxT [Marmoricola endophyticus]